MGASGIDTHQGSIPQPPSVPCGFETSWDRTLSRSVGSKPRGSVGSTPTRDRSAPQPLTAGSKPGHPSGIETLSHPHPSISDPDRRPRLTLHTDKNVWVSIPGGCTRPKTIALVAGSKPSQPKVRHPGVEPGPPRWQREIITARLMTLQDDTCRIRTYAGGTQ